MRIQKFSRPGVILLATVVVIITSIVAANATQTITAPNAAFVSYNLAEGANSAPITPASNRSVLVMGYCSTTDGVGQVSLVPSQPGNGILWVGLESCSGPSTTTTAGFTNTAGAHIVYIDFNHQVEIQVASINTIRVHNGAAFTRAGNVTLIW